MAQETGTIVRQLEKAGMHFDGASSDQLAVVNSLSSAEVDMLIGLKHRLNDSSNASSRAEDSGSFVW